jgi:hypothetical protein
MIKVGNAFSIGMLGVSEACVRIREVGLEEARALLANGFISFVGHEDTAKLFSNMLGVEIPFNRSSIKVELGERLLIGQYRGPRLPEGTTVLPEGAVITWHLVEVQ